MAVSIATFVSTFLFSAVMIIILAVLLRNKITYSHIGLRFLTLFCFIAVIRLLLPFEILSFTVTVPSATVMPIVRNSLIFAVFNIGNIHITVLNILIFIWILGIVYYNYRLYRAYRRLSCLSKLPDTDNSTAITFLNDLKQKRGISQTIRLIQNSYIATPSIIGFQKAIILLPEAIYSDAELFYIFSHELNHYQHRDNQLKLLLEVINSLYWWNPLFYLLKAQISTVLEFRADAGVVSQMSDNCAAYLECLLNLYKRQTVAYPSNISATFCAVSKQNLTRRFTYITQSEHRYKERIVYVLMICICLLLGSFSLVFEPVYPFPERYKASGIFSLDEGSSYITRNENGQYVLYVDNKNRGTIKDINDDIFKNIPVYDSKVR